MNTINYFLKFEEGDNITITADFIDNVLNLEKFIYEKHKRINELEDNQETLLNTLSIVLNEKR